MGSRELTAHAEQSLGLKMPANSSDGNHTLEPVYCLGNCACSPAVMIDERVYGRVDAESFDSLMKSAGAK
jgi:formate dehydrogenase subunit gamma